MNQHYFGKLNEPEHLFSLLDDCELAIWQEISPDSLTSYLSDLDGLEDLTEYARHEIGENRYRTYLVKEGGILNVAYTAGDRSLRVVRDPLQGTGEWVLPPQVPAVRKKICAPALSVLPLDYSHRDLTDGNGMGFAILLEDGSFILYDGGYPQDAEQLYCWLWEKTPLPNHRIVISAWILTHFHFDHYGCFRDFSRMFADRVYVRYFLLNPPPDLEEIIRHSAYDAFLSTDFYRYAAQYEGAKKIRMHTGQKLLLPGVELEVLQTFEDLLPLQIQYLNEASLVTRLRIGGQSLLFLADCEQQADRRIALFGDALSSDFVQVPHHAYSGGTPEIYRAIDPSYCLWTTNFESYAYRTLPAWRHGMFTDLLTKQKVVRSFVADGAIKEIPLPLEDIRTVRYCQCRPMSEIEQKQTFDEKEVLIRYDR